MKHIVIVLFLSLGIGNAFAEDTIKSLAPSKTTLDYDSAISLGIIRNKELLELSGIVSGGVNKDILWVQTDRNNLPTLYVLNMRGETVGAYCLVTFRRSGVAQASRLDGPSKILFDPKE